MATTFKRWSENGLVKYRDFYTNGQFRSFQDLKENYGLSNQNFYRFLQTRHYCEKMIRKEDLDKTNSSILKVFLMAYKSDPSPKNISKLYHGICELCGESTNYIKEKWEKEGNFSLHLEIWEKLNEQQWKSTSALSWREFG